jgi:hypothetical protein
MDALLPIAGRAGALLKTRGESAAVVESMTGGLVSAALLAVPGASRCQRNAWPSALTSVLSAPEVQRFTVLSGVRTSLRPPR